MAATAKNTAKKTELLPAEENGERLPELLEREERIERAQRNAYYEIGLDLKAIRDAEPVPLYKVKRDTAVSGHYSFQTWEEYLDGRWELSLRRGNQLIEIADAASHLQNGKNFSHFPSRESHVRELLALESDVDRATVWQSVIDSGKTVTASLVKEEVQIFHARKEKNWYTLDEWQKLSDEQWEQECERPSDKTFNKQDTDSIEWAKWSWNPITGCKHDCPYCYARDIAQRFYPQQFEPSIYPERFWLPQNTKVPAQAASDISFKNVFTCSMADLFGRWVPIEWIEYVMETVADNTQWNFLFLTKFPQRFSEVEIPDNAWMGTTVDCQSRVANAEKAFAKVTCGTKWLSVEPMLTPLKFKRLDLFDWVVIGGASASSKTQAWHPPFDWVVDLQKQARDAGCSVYHKSNLFGDRMREFPWEDASEAELPADLKYLDIK